MRFPHIHREQLLALRDGQEATHLSPEALERLQWLIHFTEHGRSVSETARAFGIARTTLHRWIARFDVRYPQSLEERRTTQLHQMHVPQSPVAPGPYPMVQYVPQFIAPAPSQAPANTQTKVNHALSLSSVIEKILLIATLIALGWMIGITQQTKQLADLSQSAREIVETAHMQQSQLSEQSPPLHGADSSALPPHSIK